MNLEDKILGEKLQYYCSSSEDEGNDNDNEGNDEDNCSGSKNTASKIPTISKDDYHFSSSSSNGTANTGPKGVIKDWQRFKQLETEKRQHQERERLDLMKKLSITAKTTAEDQKAKEMDEIDAEIEELMNESSLLEFQKKRMMEMLEMSGMSVPKFGSLVSLATGDDFLKAIDNENKNITIIIHIFDEKQRACRTMNQCLSKLAIDYPCVKFCRILGAATNLSKHFKTSALPTLLIYKNGQIIGNFVRMTDEFGDEFFPSDVENFLIEHSLLIDKSFTPGIFSKNNNTANDDDDDD